MKLRKLRNLSDEEIEGDRCNSTRRRRTDAAVDCFGREEGARSRARRKDGQPRLLNKGMASERGSVHQ